MNASSFAPPTNDLGVLSDVAIDLELTSVCDAVCGFCPRDVMPDKKRFITMELVERLAAEIKTSRPMMVTLCGIGESLLHPKLDTIVRTLADTGVRVEMTSHGTRITRDRFVQLVDQGLSGFSFSVNAFSAETRKAVMRLPNFDKTLQNLQEVVELRVRSYPHVVIHVSFVVCNLNHHEVNSFVEFWRPKGVSKIWLHPVNNRNTLLSPDVKPVDIKHLARKYANDDLVQVDIFSDLDAEDDLCKIAKKMIFISADGEMRLCAMDYRRETSYGNLASDGLVDMHRDRLLRFLDGEMNQFCQGCDFCPSSIRKLAMPVPDIPTTSSIAQRDMNAASLAEQEAALAAFEQRVRNWAAAAAREPEGVYVTVETPVFKGGWLMPCIESVLYQTADRWVFSAHWDGGDELSRRVLDILARLDHPRLEITFGENRGIAHTHRVLTERATGDFVLTLDDDDMLTADAVEKFLAVVEAKPWVGIVRAKRDFIDETGEPVDADPWFPFEARHYQHGAVTDVFNHAQPALMSRAAYEKTSGWEGFEEYVFAGADCDIYIKVEEKAPIELLDAVLYRYRLSNRRTSLRITDNAAFDMWRRLADRALARLGLPLKRVNDRPPFKYERLPRPALTRDMVDAVILDAHRDAGLVQRTRESLIGAGVAEAAIHVTRDRNAGIAATARAVVFHIDAGVEIAGEDLDRLLAVMDEHDADVLSPRIVTERGVIEYGAPAFDDLGTPVVSGRGEPDGPAFAFVAPAAWLPPSVMLVRREVHRAVDGFDPAYGDAVLAGADFGLKARQRDFICVYAGSVTAVNYAPMPVTTFDPDVQRLQKRWESWADLMTPAPNQMTSAIWMQSTPVTTSSAATARS